MRAARGFSWYWSRLKVMGGREILHRIHEQFSLQWLWIRQLAGRPAPSPLAAGDSGFCRSGRRLLPDLPFDFRPDGEAVEQLLAGEWPALGFPWRFASDPDVWRRAPENGRLWPSVFFSKIPYRVGNPCGDARVVWEPARLQQLVALALVARDFPERRAQAVALIEGEFLSWTKANPPYLGVHYLSAMECALRLIACCHAFDIAREWLTRRDAVFSGLAQLAGSHAHLIEKRLSLHSSAGNHTIAEAAGLVYAGTLFPEYASAARWKARGLALLAGEADRQVLGDGCGAEQAFCYARLVAELYGLVRRLLEHTGESVPAPLGEAFDRAAAFLREFAPTPRELPRLGDGDDGSALLPQLMIVWENQPARRVASPHYSQYTSRAPAFRVLLDHAPLSKPPTYAHGHADALSLTLDYAGVPILIDPGTFSYTGDPRWRRYFRSTRAHNTVAVDGLDQADQVSAFVWSRPYHARLVRREQDARGMRVLAVHDGYGHLNVTHYRGIRADDDGRLLIWDCLQGTGRHELELCWHFGMPVKRTASGAAIAAEGIVLDLRVSGADRLVWYHGDEREPMGWQSPRYGVRQACTALCARAEVELPHVFTTQVLQGGKTFDEQALSNEIRRLESWLT